jgi:hypothetical protein
LSETLTNALVLNTPCMPKGVFHCGNAISVLVAKLLYAAFKIFSPQCKSMIVGEAWTVHGLPFADEFRSAYLRSGSYEEILAYAMKKLCHAKYEKNIVDSLSKDSLVYCDANVDFMGFVQQISDRLARTSLLVRSNNEFVIDVSQFIKSPGYQAFAETVGRDLCLCFQPATKSQYLFKVVSLLKTFHIPKEGYLHPVYKLMDMLLPLILLLNHFYILIGSGVKQ